MTAEHVQWCIGLVFIAAALAIIGWAVWRRQRAVRSMWHHCPTCFRVFEDRWDRDEHFRRRHRPEVR
jgi:hypothetical protein